MSKESISNLTKTLVARNGDYGDFSDNATFSQRLKDDFRRNAAWEGMSSTQREALDAIALKLSRIATGDSYYKDNWHDIQGYAKLVENWLCQEGMEEVHVDVNGVNGNG